MPDRLGVGIESEVGIEGVRYDQQACRIEGGAETQQLEPGVLADAENPVRSEQCPGFQKRIGAPDLDAVRDEIIAKSGTQALGGPEQRELVQVSADDLIGVGGELKHLLDEFEFAAVAAHDLAESRRGVARQSRIGGRRIIEDKGVDSVAGSRVFAQRFQVAPHDPRDTAFAEEKLGTEEEGSHACSGRNREIPNTEFEPLRGRLKR